MMEASILIVSKNRKKELQKTLTILENYLDNVKHEVCVFLDGCTENSETLKDVFPNVNWQSSKKSLGASRARSILYQNAKGNILIGLDDDAHPLQSNFIELSKNIFLSEKNIGVIAFKEIKGIFNSDQDAISSYKNIGDNYYCNSFIGCGFAIRKDVYNETNGFPVWIDIYGEESCVALEVLSKGYDIINANTILVNHRVDIKDRKQKGYDQFRFERQLKNTALYFLVYYKNPLIPLLKLFWHNFNKYAFLDTKYFIAFFKAIFKVLIKLPKIILFRNPVSKEIIKMKINLKSPQF